MSFFDDASLVFLPSGQAGKDGKAYSMKPVPEYGSELVTNGDFATDSDWTKGTGWTISGGTANCDGTQTANSLFYQNLGDLSNKTIRMTFTISGYGGGQLSTAFFGASGTQVEDITANGTYIFNIDVQSGHNGNSGFTANSSFVGSIDNVSFKEVIVGDGDFTFSRGSNLTATRVDSNGLIEKGRENLLLQSNQFDTTWTTIGTSVTSGQSGYDGSSDAWLLESNNTGGAYISQNITASGVQTFSIYAKAGTCNFIYFVVRGTTNIASYFDLENGTIGTAVAVNIDRKIESVGSGWYRCSITLSNTDTSVRVYMADADGSTTSAVGSNIYIQDAQLEQGLVATEYISSGATTGLAGILEDSPRFDYSGGASCPSLLLEPSRTNLIGQSEYKASGDFTNSTPSYNAASSPEGLQNATEMFDDSTNGQHRVPIGSFAVTSGTDYTISAFVKNNDIGYCYLLLEGDFTQTRYYFNLSTGQPITSGLEVENFEDGWYRIYVTQSAASSGTGSVYLNMSNNGVSPIYVGSGQSLYFYGLQAEQGSYPTSYIPNHSGGSVTREADVCGGAGTSSTFNDDEGVLYLEASAIDNGSSEKAIAINDGTTNNRINIRIVNNTIKGLVILGGSLVCNISYTAPSVITSNKIAFKYKRNDFALWVNGVEVGTDTSGSTFTADTLNELSFDYGGTSAFFYGNVEQVLYFPSALSDAELTALTS